MVGAVALGAACLVLAPSASADKPGRELFTENTVGSTAALESRPGTAGVWTKRADAAAVDSKTDVIELDLGNQRVTAHRTQVRTTALGSTVWEGSTRDWRPGSVRSDEKESVVLVRRGDGVTGSVRVDGRLYRIQPVAGGQHAVTEVDESHMPPDHPRTPGGPPTVRMTETPAAAANTVIRVQVIGTSDAATGFGGDLRALAELAVAETNRGYENSGIGITMELSGYETVEHKELEMTADLARFRDPADGVIDGIHASRDKQQADVNVLLVNDKTACGLASSIGSDATTAFAAVYHGCATGYYTFAHEIGHLQSARHDPENDSSTTPFAYGHGFRNGSAWRTIMAYDCATSCSRLNYWSNPQKSYEGVTMGTTDKSDNARVLNDTKATIAAFR
ncbi:M12 family metallo-peptidase [Actinokineospora sp.]|uniref:M12 family metallo-peptidase n=1 Tax=Actinokineospora sp. TaxID=1872133 RepID=UPI003D6B17E4